MLTVLPFKKGNTLALQVLVKDKNGDILSNLSTADSVKFSIKNNATDAETSAILNKDLTNGITVDDPSLGYITIKATAAEMEIAAGVYFYGIEINYPASPSYPAGQRIEINLAPDLIKIIQDVVHP